MIIVEMNSRSFIEHILGIKKTIVFLVICYLAMITPIWNSFDPESNIKGFLILNLLLTLLISWIIYWQYAQYERVIDDFKKSGLLKFLLNNGFVINEKPNGWNYEINISGSYTDSVISIYLSSRKGDIWNKYFLNFEGISLLDYQDLNSREEHSIPVSFYSETIKLTKNQNVVRDLKEHLHKFSCELNEKNTSNKRYVEVQSTT